jgi:hypothetical protein
MEEVAGNIIFKQDEKAQFEPNDQINTIWLQEECDPGYFADTENEPLEYSEMIAFLLKFAEIRWLILLVFPSY